MSFIQVRAVRDYRKFDKEQQSYDLHHFIIKSYNSALFCVVAFSVISFHNQNVHNIDLDCTGNVILHLESSKTVCISVEAKRPKRSTTDR